MSVNHWSVAISVNTATKRTQEDVPHVNATKARAYRNLVLMQNTTQNPLNQITNNIHIYTNRNEKSFNLIISPITFLRKARDRQVCLPRDQPRV